MVRLVMRGTVNTLYVGSNPINAVAPPSLSLRGRAQIKKNYKSYEHVEIGKQSLFKQEWSNSLRVQVSLFVIMFQ
jgi:hypothetical protein